MHRFAFLAIFCLWVASALAAPTNLLLPEGQPDVAGLSRHFADFDHEVELLTTLDVGSRLYLLKRNPKIVSMHLKALRQMYAAHCLQFINYVYLANAFEHPEDPVLTGVTPSYLGQIARPSTSEVKEDNHAGRIRRISAQLDKEAKLFKKMDQEVAAHKVDPKYKDKVSFRHSETMSRQLSRAMYDRDQSNTAHWALLGCTTSANAEFYSAADLARDEEMDERYRHIPEEGIPKLTYGPSGSLAQPTYFVAFPEVRQWILEAYIMRIAVGLWDLEMVYAQQRMKQANPDGKTLVLPLHEDVKLLPPSILSLFPLPETKDEETLMDATSILMNALEKIEATRSSTFSMFSFKKAHVIEQKIEALKATLGELSVQYHQLIGPSSLTCYTDERR